MKCTWKLTYIREIIFINNCILLFDEILYNWESGFILDIFPPLYISNIHAGLTFTVAMFGRNKVTGPLFLLSSKILQMSYLKTLDKTFPYLVKSTKENITIGKRITVNWMTTNLKVFFRVINSKYYNVRWIFTH